MLHQKEKSCLDPGIVGDSSRARDQLSSNAKNNNSAPRNQNYLSNIVDETKHLMGFDENKNQQYDKSHESQTYHQNYPEDGYSSSNLHDESLTNTGSGGNTIHKAGDSSTKYANYSYKSMVNPVVDDRDIEESERRIRDLAQEKKMAKQYDDKKELPGKTRSNSGGFLRRLSIGGNNKSGTANKKYSNDTYDDEYGSGGTDKNDLTDRSVNFKQRAGNYQDNDNYQNMGNNYDDTYSGENIHSQSNNALRDDQYYGNQNYDTAHQKGTRNKISDDYVLNSDNAVSNEKYSGKNYGTTNEYLDDKAQTNRMGKESLETGYDTGYSNKGYNKKDNIAKDYSGETYTKDHPNKTLDRHDTHDTHDTHSNGENTGILASISNYLGMSGNSEDADHDDNIDDSIRVKDDYSKQMPGALDSDLNDSSYIEEPQWHNTANTSGNTANYDTSNTKRTVNSNQDYDEGLSTGLAGVGLSGSGINAGSTSKNSKYDSNPHFSTSDSKYVGNSNVRKTDFEHDDFKASLLAPSGVDSTENFKNAQLHQKNINKIQQPGGTTGTGIGGTGTFVQNNNANVQSRNLSNDQNTSTSMKSAPVIVGGSNLGKTSHSSGSKPVEMTTESQPYRLVQNPKDEQHLKSANAENLKIKNKSAFSESNISTGGGSNMYGQEGYQSKKAGINNNTAGIQPSNASKGNSRILNSDYKGMKSMKQDSLNTGNNLGQQNTNLQSGKNANIGGSASHDGYYAGTKGKSSSHDSNSGPYATAGVLTQNVATGEYNTSGLRRADDSGMYGGSGSTGATNASRTAGTSDVNNYNTISTNKNTDITTPQKKFVRDSNGKTANVQTENYGMGGATNTYNENNKYLSNDYDGNNSSKHDSGNGLGKIKNLFTGKDKKQKSHVGRKNVGEHGTVFNDNNFQSDTGYNNHDTNNLGAFTNDNYTTSSTSNNINQGQYQHDSSSHLKNSEMTSNPRTQTHSGKMTGHSAGQGYVTKNDSNGGTITYEDDGLQGTQRKKSLIENIKEVF